MTPKEKAIELISRFSKELKWIETDYNIYLYRDVKECALIAVDEIISIKPLGGSFDGAKNSHHYYSVKYWKEVRKEIEKL